MTTFVPHTQSNHNSNNARLCTLQLRSSARARIVCHIIIETWERTKVQFQGCLLNSSHIRNPVTDPPETVFMNPDSLFDHFIYIHENLNCNSKKTSPWGSIPNWSNTVQYLLQFIFCLHCLLLSEIHLIFGANFFSRRCARSPLNYLSMYPSSRLCLSIRQCIHP
jgi:hypothetical protein